MGLKGWTSILILYNLIGFLLFTGKFSFLVAGYLNTPKEKRASYNWAKISKYVAVLLWISSIGLVIMAFTDDNPNTQLHTFGLLLFLGTILGGAIYVNISKRFRI